jgi:plasmid stabilization system protein ParE
MPQLIWSSPALQDVARLHAFLRSKNREAASRAVRTIRESVKILARYPEIGRPVDDMEPEFRDWLVKFGDGGCLARYHYDGRDIVILAVRHTKEAGLAAIALILGRSGSASLRGGRGRSHPNGASLTD